MPRVFALAPVFFCHAVARLAPTVTLMPACLPAGQIELYTHHPFLPTLVRNLQRLGMRTSAVYLLDSQFMEDKYKFFRCAIKLTPFILLARGLVYVHFDDGRDRWRRHTLFKCTFSFLPCVDGAIVFPRLCGVTCWFYALCPNSANPVFLDPL
jgi:hypothetical protein